MSQSTATEIEALTRQIDTRIAESQTRINSTLDDSWFLPDWLKVQIVTLWNRFLTMIEQLWESVREVFQNLGDPSKLVETANEWSTKVGTPVSTRVSTATEGVLGVDDNWTGTAADRYKEHLLNQRTALDKIKSKFTTGIADALSGMATSIWVFWSAMIVGLIAFIAQLIASFAADATVIGIPVGILLKITAVATLIACISVGIVQLRLAAGNARTALNNTMDFTGYPDGSWPLATTS